jgi:hypothetical protein
MRRRVGPGLQIACILVVALSQAHLAAAAFERIPGPVPGGNASWAFGTSESSRPRRWGIRFATGQPASTADTGWSYARCRVAWKHWRVASDVYGLGFDDCYHETAIGFWGGCEHLLVGFRRWEVEWKDAGRRIGLSASGACRIESGPLGLRLSMQDIRLGTPGDASAPPSRIGAGIDFRFSRSLVLEGWLFETQDGPSGNECGVRWSPIPDIVLFESVNLPMGMLRSGIEIQTRGPVVGLWIEPSVDLGARAGVACAFE